MALRRGRVRRGAAAAEATQRQAHRVRASKSSSACRTPIAADGCGAATVAAAQRTSSSTLTTLTSLIACFTLP